MTDFRRQGWFWLAAFAAVVMLGCKRDGNPQGQPVGPTPGAKKAPGAVEVAKPAPPAVKPPATIPQVVMAQQDRATCRVGAGDTMPEAELPQLGGKPEAGGKDAGGKDAGGKKVSLRSLFGKKLTVVVFWTSKSMDAIQELQDLELDVAQPYAGKGLKVIGINEQDNADAAAKSLKTAGAAFANLTDPGGEYFAKVATAGLPRTYLLDAQGKILWFDIVYSRSTRRDLETGIKVALGELK
jgi:thiol-disulfide isomerase/thioredoxin